MLARLRHRHRVDRILRNWALYRTMVQERLGHDDLRPEEEGRFLALKGRLAEQLAALSQELAGNASLETQVGQREIGEFLNRHTTLHTDEPLGADVSEAFDRDWHRHFLYLNRLRGMKPQRRAARPPEIKVSMTAPPRVPYGPRPAGFGRWLALLLLRLGVLVVIVWAVVRFVPWGAVETAANRTDPGSVKSWAVGAWGDAKETARGVGQGSIQEFFEPVVEKYGAETTAVLAGVLLLAVGYWMFIRTK